MKVRKALVCGAGGFIGPHLVSKLKKEDFHVTGVDLVSPRYGLTGPYNSALMK